MGRQHWVVFTFGLVRDTLIEINNKLKRRSLDWFSFKLQFTVYILQIYVARIVLDANFYAVSTVYFFHS